MTDQDKIDYIENIDVPYVKTNMYPLNLLYRLAQVQEIVQPRLGKELECFGEFDREDLICKDCFLGVNGTCKTLADYLYYIDNKDDLVAIANRVGDLSKMTEESIKDILDNAKFREDSDSLEIAKTILNSNNKPFGELMDKIQAICKDSDLNYARTRYYQIKKKLEESSDLKIGTIIQKFVHITKRINS